MKPVGSTSATSSNLVVADHSRLAPLLHALRPHQWVKNLLLFVPLITSHELRHLRPTIQAAWAFVAFSLCASAVYLINDIVDVESDRRHPTKRNRPIAAGQITIGAALTSCTILLIGSFLITALLPRLFGVLLALYLVLTTAYSFWLKRKLLVDVMMLAALYTLRILAGAAAVSVAPSPWLLAFSLFFFLSLAFVKRYSELMQVEGEGGEEARGRSYTVHDLRMIESMGPAAGYLSVMVFCIYLDSAMVKSLYPHHHEMLWLVTPVLLYWITRIWFIARRRALHEDPIVFAMRDRVSYLAGFLVAILLFAAARDWQWPTWLR